MVKNYGLQCPQTSAIELSFNDFDYMFNKTYTFINFLAFYAIYKAILRPARLLFLEKIATYTFIWVKPSSSRWE